MRRLIHRPPGRKKVWGAGLVTAAALALTASLAFGQAVPATGPDGGPIEPPGPNPMTTQCGQSLTDTVVTNNRPNTTAYYAGFQAVPGETVNINVPAQRCVKVLYTAEASCGPSAAQDICYLQAMIDGVPMDPYGNGFQAFASESPTAAAHADEWIKRVPAGNHQVQIQWRVSGPTTLFRLDDRTLDVQVLQ
jgi:hypothetical protein